MLKMIPAYNYFSPKLAIIGAEPVRFRLDNFLGSFNINIEIVKWQ